MWARIKQWWSNRNAAPEPPQFVHVYSYAGQRIEVTAANSTEAITKLRDEYGTRVFREAWLQYTYRSHDE